MTQKIGVEELLHLIPESKLHEFAVSTEVDHSVKKLKGHVLFKLLLYSVIKSDRVSSRVIEAFFNSRSFQFLADMPLQSKTRHSSISDRLAHVEVSFFEKIYEYVVSELGRKYVAHSAQGQKIKRFDSTIVSLSSRLLHVGMSNDSRTGSSKRDNGRKQVKFTVGFDGLLPHQVDCYLEQNYLNENLALSETILNQRAPYEGITVFDRGLRGRKTFVLLCEENVKFVTRLDERLRYETIEVLSTVFPQTETLDIQQDLKVYLFTTNTKVKQPFRLIIATNRNTGKILYFLTNIFECTALEITEIYRKRWDIEVFFRFLKQEMNFSHLISRNENGIKVMFYLTMIASMLILVYRHVNELPGYKIVKLQFVNELEFSLIKDIVTLCGGDPQKLDYPIRR
ncbi:MAG: IS4 family transposase [Candidatus Saccharibacteria bacterium]|nr:IS4 family transposase [Candidatus Saccharibacteria bacterium]